MSMVVLLIAPLIQGKDEWEDWWMGLFPLFLAVAGTGVLIFTGVLTWKDPLNVVQTDVKVIKEMKSTTVEAWS